MLRFRRLGEQVKNRGCVSGGCDIWQVVAGTEAAAGQAGREEEREMRRGAWLGGGDEAPSLLLRQYVE